MSSVLIIKNANFSEVAVEKVQITDKVGIYGAVTPAGSGVITGTGFYDAGDSVSVGATPNLGYRFLNWADGVFNNPRTVTVGNFPKTYKAIFAIGNDFTWGLGGLISALRSSGSQNRALTVIDKWIYTQQETTFICLDGYTFSTVCYDSRNLAAGTDLTTLEYNANYTETSITIPANKYVTLAIEKVGVTHTDPSVGKLYLGYDHEVTLIDPVS